MRKHPVAYLAAALAAGLSPMLVLVFISIPTWHGMASFRGFVALGIIAFAFALVYLTPVAALLRRMLLFRAAVMGVAGVFPPAAMAAWLVIGNVVRMPDGSVRPLPWWDVLMGIAFYGSLGAGSGVVFYFVFRAIAGDDRLLPGGTVDA